MSQPESTKSPRAKAYHAVRNRFSGGVARFYRNNPEYLDNEIARKGVSLLLEIMHEVLSALDCYEIEELKEDRRKGNELLQFRAER